MLTVNFKGEGGKSGALSCKCMTQKALNLNCLTLNPMNYSKLQGHLHKHAYFLESICIKRLLNIVTIII